MLENRRLFFAFGVEAPWPDLPRGHVVAENMRHLTVAFLGNAPFELLHSELNNIPLPSFKVGFSGYFDRCLFLPERHPHVAAWHGVLAHHSLCEEYSIQLSQWLQNLGYAVDQKLPWLPHVTLARYPFNKKEWAQSFKMLPLTSHFLHLYESLPGMHYTPLWSHSLLLPFEEIEHTADRAFIIRGESVQALFKNACAALAFDFPPIIKHLINPPDDANGIVPSLNRVLALTDTKESCPFKAVSYHGDINKTGTLYEWEMIVDV